jgi:hypothetical protein
MTTVGFDKVISHLRDWRQSALQRLRDPTTKDEALALKLQLDGAIGCLELCMRHRISPGSRVIVLPEADTRSPSAEFRLVEDHESDRREVWTEVMVDGAPVRPSPGSLIISQD